MLPAKATGSCSNTSLPGRQTGSLIVSHLPGTRMERAEMSPEPSCSAMDILLVGVPGTSPPTRVAALWQQRPPSSCWCCHRAKKDKIKPFAITQVELSSFYWLCCSISSRGMQLWMEARWLSPVEDTPMFLGVLQFNLFFLYYLSWWWNPNATWLGIINGPNSFPHVLDYYPDLTTKIVTKRHVRRTFLPVLMSHWYLLSPSQPYHKTISTINIFTGILCGVVANTNIASAF